MKFNYRKLAALTVCLLALCAIGSAQDFASKVRVDVPFSFYAGGTLLPAGEYSFALNRETSNIAIRGEIESAGTFLLGAPENATKGSFVTLTFRSDGQGGFVLERFQGPDFGFSFAARKAGKKSGLVADSHASGGAEVVIATLIK
jgi:hypothetical protein